MNDINTNIPNLDLLTIEGKDSEDFLQGQLTCDVKQLTLTEGSFSAICNNKGRVVSSFLIVRTEICFMLFLPIGMGEITIKHLNKYKIFYKADIKLNTSNYRVTSLFSREVINQFQDRLPAIPTKPLTISSNDTLSIMSLPNALHQEPSVLCWGLTENMTWLAEIKNPIVSDQWLAHTDLAGCHLINSPESEQFTPQELNYDLIGAISFDKGCYTGQEIVARIHYRGKQKKRLQLVSSALPEELTENMNELLCSAMQVIIGDNTLTIIGNMLIFNNIIYINTLVKSELQDKDLEAFITLEHQTNPKKLPAKLQFPLSN